MGSACQTWVMEGIRGCSFELDALVKTVDAAVAVVVDLLGLEVLLTLIDGVGSNAVVLIIFLVTTLLEIKCDQGTILTPIWKY